MAWHGVGEWEGHSHLSSHLLTFHCMEMARWWVGVLFYQHSHWLDHSGSNLYENEFCWCWWSETWPSRDLGIKYPPNRWPDHELLSRGKSPRIWAWTSHQWKIKTSHHLALLITILVAAIHNIILAYFDWQSYIIQRSFSLLIRVANPPIVSRRWKWRWRKK